jgi:uncharacterized protein (UPF0335 family)
MFAGANGQSTPTSPSEGAFSALTFTRDCPALRAASKDTAASCRALHMASDEQQSGVEAFNSPKSTTPENQHYDEAAMNKIEDMIAEMSRMEMSTIDTEAPSEWEAVSDQSTSAQLRQEVQSPSSQTLIDVDTTSSVPADGLVNQTLSYPSTFGFHTTVDEPVSRSKGKESAFHLSDNQSVVRCTPQVWDTMIKQMSTLKKERMEALAKLASLEQDYDLRRQSKGDNSSELDQLRYRLEVNKDFKAIMSRDIRQKDVELLNKDLELDTLKKQIADLEAMREQCEKLQAEIHYLRNEAEQSGADVGQMKQIVLFKEQEIAELKESLAHSKTKTSDHQRRAENLADTQGAREKKLYVHPSIVKEKDLANNS